MSLSDGNDAMPESSFSVLLRFVEFVFTDFCSTPHSVVHCGDGGTLHCFGRNRHMRTLTLHSAHRLTACPHSTHTHAHRSTEAHKTLTFTVAHNGGRISAHDEAAAHWRRRRREEQHSVAVHRQLVQRPPGVHHWCVCVGASLAGCCCACAVYVSVCLCVCVRGVAWVCLV